LSAFSPPWGDVLKPKSFAGLFSAAPSVALATLPLTILSDGKRRTVDAGGRRDAARERRNTRFLLNPRAWSNLDRFHNFYLAVAAQNLDANTLAMSPYQEIDCCICDPKILDPHFLKIRWQRRIRKTNDALGGTD
jgi:hypothetical protein